MNMNNKKNLHIRHKYERAFHDKKYKSEKTRPSHYRHDPSYKVFLKLKKEIGSINGKQILEYGCGEGWLTAELVSMGANVKAFDVSPEAIRRTKELLNRKVKNGNYEIREMTAERLLYDDNSFDIAIGFAILHHLDLDRAIPELCRVLKDNGVGYFAEPLGTNPFLNLYRKLTPEFRTPDEKPIVMDDFLARYSVRFSSCRHSEFYLTALFPLFLSNFALLSRVASRLIDPLFKFDEMLLSRVPSLGKWAWYSIICLTK